jgi:hypothetical protein
MKSKKKSVQVKIVPDPTVTVQFPRFYSNYVAVHSTPFDMTLRFCDVAPIFDKEAGEDGIVENHVPIVAEVVLPPSIFPGLIEAMAKQYDKYLESYTGAEEHEKKK